MPKISAIFDTRREAEMAVEHLVQQLEIERSYIFIAPVSDENSAGVEVAGSDAKRDGLQEPSGDEAALNGQIEVSLDRDEGDEQAVRDTFEEFKATDIKVS
ncbi:MAG: hypothetical protein ACRCY3_01840 [Sphingorhabdus sp.]